MQRVFLFVVVNKSNKQKHKVKGQEFVDQTPIIYTVVLVLVPPCIGLFTYYTL